MKKHIFFIAAVLATAPVVAEDTCKGIAEFAEVAMMARQTGQSLVDIKEAIRSQTPDMSDPDQAVARAVMMAVLEEAYEIPRFSTNKYKIQAVEDFVNEKALACYKGSR